VNHSLAVVLGEMGRHKEAEAASRAALRVRPCFDFLAQLGLALEGQGRLREAEAEHRAALAIEPNRALGYYNLGHNLGDQKRFAEAESAYRDALKLDPDYPQALCNLGNAFYLQGHFEEALINIRRGHELGTKRRDWVYASADWVRAAEQAVDLDRRFAAVVAGKAKPKDSADLMLLARFGANHKKQYAIVAQMFS